MARNPKTRAAPEIGNSAPPPPLPAAPTPSTPPVQPTDTASPALMTQLTGGPSTNPASSANTIGNTNAPLTTLLTTAPGEVEPSSQTEAAVLETRVIELESDVAKLKADNVAIAEQLADLTAGFARLVGFCNAQHGINERVWLALADLCKAPPVTAPPVREGTLAGHIDDLPKIAG